MNNQLNIKEIAQNALNAIEALLNEWLPSGKYDKGEYVALNPTRADKSLGSFRINLKSGVWKDFAIDNAEGGDLVSLYAYLNACSQLDAAKAVSERLGMGNLNAPENKEVFHSKGKKNDNHEWTPILPIPEKYHATMPKKSRSGREPEAIYYYRNENGELLGAVLRFPPSSDGRKAPVPVTFCKNEKGEMKWCFRGFNEPKPLYGLDDLANRPDAVVLVVEGEKCKDAVKHSRHLERFVPISWIGGASAWQKADWSPLAGRKVILWADADSQREKLTIGEKEHGITEESKPYLPKYEQAGMKAMLGIAKKLAELGCDVMFVRLPEVGQIADGYDVADAIRDGVKSYYPVATMFQGDNLWDWLDSYQAVLADFKRVSTTSEKKGARLKKSVKIENSEETRVQNQNLDDFATQNQKPANDSEFGSSPENNLLKTLLEKYALIGQKERALNLESGETLSRRQLEKIFTENAVDAWLYHRDCKKMLEFEAQSLSKRLILEQKTKVDTYFGRALNRYIYLDGTTDAFDIRLDDKIPLAAVKAAIPEEYEDWEKSSRRLVCPISNYVFEPDLPVGISYSFDENGFKKVDYINIFKGLPIQAKQVEPLPSGVYIRDNLVKYQESCGAIIGLVWHLCKGNGTLEQSISVFQWVLCWLAYRLRFPNLKPATALVLYSDVHGVGKSTFSEKIIKALFGRYYRQFDQNALESKFNGMFAHALITVFEEISPSDERFNVIGKLKNMITSETIVIENKHSNAKEFNDYNSYLINTNDLRALPLEINDRRFQVINCEEKFSTEQFEELEECLKKGGLESFVELLYALPLEYKDPDKSDVYHKFTHHTKPLMTPIKKRMINLNKQGWEAFFDDWQNGDIRGLPFVSVCSQDLWAVYVWWCDYTKTFKSSQKAFFSAIAGRFYRDYRTQVKVYGQVRKMRFFALSESLISKKYTRPNTHQTTRDGSQPVVTVADYYGKQIQDFHDAAKDLLPNLQNI